MSKEDIIVKAANELFSKFGIKKTTVDEIAKKARMGKSSIYHYFKSKEDIFAEVIRRDSNKFRKRLSDTVAKGETPQQKIRNYILARIEHLKELSNYYTTLTDEYLEHYFFVDQARKDFSEFEHQLLKEIVIEGMFKHIFDVSDLDATVRVVSTIAKGLEYPYIVKESNIDLERESHAMLNILFKGLETRKE